MCPILVHAYGVVSHIVCFLLAERTERPDDVGDGDRRARARRDGLRRAGTGPGTRARAGGRVRGVSRRQRQHGRAIINNNSPTHSTIHREFSSVHPRAPMPYLYKLDSAVVIAILIVRRPCINRTNQNHIILSDKKAKKQKTPLNNSETQK